MGKIANLKHSSSQRPRLKGPGQRVARVNKAAIVIYAKLGDAYDQGIISVEQFNGLMKQWRAAHARLLSPKGWAGKDFSFRTSPWDSAINIFVETAETYHTKITMSSC